MKFGPESQKIWKLNNVSIHRLVIWAAAVVNENHPKYPENIIFTKTILGVRQKAVLLQAGHVVGKKQYYCKTVMW